MKERWYGPAPWGSPECIRYLALALAGEAGEVANVIKKDWRGDDGIHLPSLVGEELADVFIYTQMLAEALDLDLPTEVKNKLAVVDARIARRRIAEGLVEAF